MKNRIKLCLLYLLSFAATVAPIVIYISVNHGKYVKNVSDSVKLSVGFIICAVLVLMKVIGKLKMPSRVVTYSFVFLLAYLLESILNDLIVFSFLALLGEIMDLVIQIPIRRIKEQIHIGRTADATAERVEQIMEQYFRGGANE